MLLFVDIIILSYENVITTNNKTSYFGFDFQRISLFGFNFVGKCTFWFLIFSKYLTPIQSKHTCTPKMLCLFRELYTQDLQAFFHLCVFIILKIFACYSWNFQLYMNTKNLKVRSGRYLSNSLILTHNN